MATAQFRLLYPSGSGSVSISIEDGIPKPLMKSKEGLYELNRPLQRDTKYNYQIFLDDEPQQIEVFDTASAKPKSDLNTLQDFSSLCLVDMDSKDQPSSHDTISGGGGAAAVLDEPPEFGHGDSHSDNETVSSELDSPLTPTRFEGFENEQTIHSMLHEKHHLKTDGYNTPRGDSFNEDSHNTIHIEHASPNTSENQAEPASQCDVLETSRPEEKETEDHAVDPITTNDVSMTNGVFFTPMAPDADDYLDDRCIVDDLIQELREKDEIQLKAEENTTAEVITTQLQAFSKFGPADILRLESMFTSFIMIIILQAVVKAFSFAKASLD
jgi:hypothetical protein